MVETVTYGNYQQSLSFCRSRKQTVWIFDIRTAIDYLVRNYDFDN